LLWKGEEPINFNNTEIKTHIIVDVILEGEFMVVEMILLAR